MKVWHYGRLYQGWVRWFFVLQAAGLMLSACGGPTESIPTLAATANAPQTAFAPQTASAPEMATQAEGVERASPQATAELATTAVSAGTALPEAVAATETPAFQTYVVAAGDDIWTIAARHGLPVDALLAANETLDENSPLQPGQVLQVPPATQDGDVGAAVRYRVREGDTFSSIAADFGIDAALLQQANPQVQPEVLQVGTILRVPWDGVHIVGPGESLQGIAQYYEVGFEDLVQANKQVLDFNNLNHIEVGWELTIPRESEAVADCTPVGGRQVVVQHVIAAGEGLFCLAQKFGLQPPTIIHSNPQIAAEGGLAPGVTLLIPPSDGALYVYSEEDGARGVTLQQIMDWYSVYGSLDDVVDWEGNRLPLPLQPGQELFIAGADPLSSVFDSGWLATDVQTPAPPPVAGGGEDAAGPPAAPGGATFSGLMAMLWDSPVTRGDPGYCAYQAGSGWTGSLAWPISSREIREDRGYKPGHEAIDIVAPEGTAVYAAESGVVIWAGYASYGGGIFIMLAHGNYWHTYYGHLSQAVVGCGQQVSRGAVIGYSGQTGTAWPHLHFAVHNESTPYNPLNYLR